MINLDNDPFKSLSKTDKPDRSERSLSVDGDSEVKPKKTPNARKDFKDVLGNKQDETEDFDSSTLSKTNSDGNKESSLMSLFGSPTPKKTQHLTDVADQKMLLESGAEVSPLTQNQPLSKLKRQEFDSQIKGTSHESPSALFGKLSSSSDKNTKDSGLAKKGTFNSEYAQGLSDISFVNPNPNINNINNINPINLAAGTKVTQTESVTSPIHDIVVELIDKLAIVQTKGQTDTVVTLNAPGIFKGAIVVMSEFDTANGQLNIAFENLTSQAKTLLDNLPNRESLLIALSAKGYTVQQIITTTTIEHQPIISTQTESQLGKSREDNPKDGDFTKQKKKDE